MKNKNLKNKKAFTLAELLCVVAIIGIVTAFALATMKPEQKVVRYQYMNAYNALSKAYYNAVIKGMNPFTTSEVDGVTPVHTSSKDTGTEILCKGLTTFINTFDNKKDGDDDYSTTCSDTAITPESADSFAEDNIQFTATNGMRFYISKLLGDDELPFYIVFVDVNGQKEPNSMDYVIDKKGKIKAEPDIYPFVMLNTGRVMPIGVAEYDRNILSARFAYFDDSGEPVYTRKSLAYYQAKGAAWGYYNQGKDSLEYNESEPFTMNDIVRSKISSSSKIVKDFPDLKNLSPIEIASTNPYKCSITDIDSCYIFLDEYQQY